MDCMKLKCIALCFLGLLSTTPTWADQAQIDSARSAWLNKAFAGDAEGQYHLGEAYCCDTVEHTRQALRWYCRAAVQGYADAQYEMGRIFANDLPAGSDAIATAGLFIAKRSAYMWFTAAAATGHDPSFAARAKLGATMPASAVAEAKRWATRWKQASCSDAGF